MKFICQIGRERLEGMVGREGRRGRKRSQGKREGEMGTQDGKEK